MEADEVRAEELFKADQQLQIPIWQRHYSWDRADWKELWRDLERLKSGEATDHFVGSVVLHETEHRPRRDEARRFLVVDGQQRVTTLTIIVCALRDRLARLEPDTESSRRALDEMTDQLLISRTRRDGHRERLVLQPSDHQALRSIIEGESIQRATTPIGRAYGYFSAEIATWRSEEVEQMLDILRNQLHLVWVTLGASDNSHRVFQTLNAGGKQLRQADLVRNYFFLLLGADGEEFYRDQWSSLERLLSERELADYFVAWSITQGHTGGKESLFKYFQDDLRQSEEDVDAVSRYGAELVECARLFDEIRRPENMGDSPAQDVLAELTQWGAIPVEGLVLFLLRAARSGQLTSAELADALEIVLSFLARRMMAGFEPNLHKSIAVGATLKLRAMTGIRGQSLVTALRAILSAGSDVRTWPSDELVYERAVGTSLYTKSRAKWVFSILERINRRMHENVKHAPARLDRSKYSIEHVLPQTLTSAWEGDLIRWGVDKPAALHASKVHVLGNLTITPVNPELSNRPLAEKVVLFADDFLKLNSQIATVGEWTEARIDERSRKLANVAVQAFVRPMTASELKVHGEASASERPPVLEGEELPGDEE